MNHVIGRFTCCLIFAVASLASAAEPLFEKVDLFQSQQDGYALYRIPGIVVTPNGTVLAYCEARRTGKSDWDTIDLYLRRSTDGGKTFGPRQKIADVPGPKVKNPVALAQKLANSEDVTYNNPVAIVDRTGTLHFLFCLEYARCFSLRSDDDGQTFSAPVEITGTFEKFRSEYDWKVLATGPGHGIQLKSGRLVVPVWLSTGTGGHAHRPSVTATIFSDDHGQTWQRGEIAVPNTDEWVFPNETVIVELADGRVMLNVRSESKEHRRIIVTSRDGASGWSKPRFDDSLLEPICMASIVRYSARPQADKNRILFANPHNLERADGKTKEGGSRDRKNLSIKLTYDEGETWPVSKSLEPGHSAYSDLAVLPDGTILCFYERGRATKEVGKKPTSYGYLTLARLNLEWLTDGKDVTAPFAGRAGSPNAIADPKRFESAIAAFEDADRVELPPARSTLFVGASNIRLWSSLTQRFQPQKVINRGFGGAHLSDVVHFADRIAIPYKPKAIYLNAGGNDLHAGKPPEQVAVHFEEFVGKIRAGLPESSLSFISIPPSPKRWSEVEQVKQANRLIADLVAEDGKIEFVDVFPLLLNEQGLPREDCYLTDQLHFSERGYDIVTSAIRWQKAVLNLEKLDRETPPPANPVLFIGSSSIVRWKSLKEDFPDIPVLNHGFGGSEVFDSVTYAHRLVIPYRPKMVVMYAGGNDINRGKTPERVAADCREFAKRVHASLPDTRIAFISIAGNPARWSQVERVKEANALIESFTKTDQRLTFINVFPHMLGSDGLPLPDIFVADRLHMNENGYAIWKQVVRPYLKK